MLIIPDLRVEIFNKIHLINNLKVGVWFCHKAQSIGLKEQAQCWGLSPIRIVDHMQWSIDVPIQIDGHDRTPDGSGRVHQSIGGGINR